MSIQKSYTALKGAVTKSFQEELSPAQAIELLHAGHRRFNENTPLKRSRIALLEDASEGQSPFAAVLGCIDSRVPIEEVFDATIGDLFIARVAGNTVNPDILGSLEYACKYAGSKAILVLGHTSCGAIKGAWAGLEDGNLTGLLAQLKPAVETIRATRSDEATAKNIDETVAVNVQMVCDRIRQESDILYDMESKGAIAILGGVYNVATGRVTFLEESEA
ncbi:MAG: carbonic anhydrase [Flavobacteriales bacterium]|nr:carbonic anhydrase [Flavobacteriales bacterium]